MNTLKRQFLPEIFRIFDMGVCLLSFVGSIIITQNARTIADIQRLINIRISVANFVIFFALIVTWNIILSSRGLYDPRRFSSMRKQIKDLLKASFLCTGTIRIQQTPL